MPGPGPYGNKKPVVRKAVKVKKEALGMIRKQREKHKKAKLAG